MSRTPQARLWGGVTLSERSLGLSSWPVSTQFPQTQAVRPPALSPCVPAGPPSPPQRPPESLLRGLRTVSSAPLSPNLRSPKGHTGPSVSGSNLSLSPQTLKSALPTEQERDMIPTQHSRSQPTSNACLPPNALLLQKNTQTPPCAPQLRLPTPRGPRVLPVTTSSAPSVGPSGPPVAG